MIELRGLTKRFGDIPAIENVSFKIEPGEIFALLGPNGSDKTTTLKCMVGLVKPTSGKVLLDGVDPWRNSRAAKRLLSYLPQRVCFHENLTGREVLEFYCRLRKLPLGRIYAVLASSSLSFNGLADRPVSQLSGGMVQRLGIAVAALADAPVLVFDEPTISLDPEGTLRFRQYILSLKQQGKTIVFSSHVLTDVELLADRVAMFLGGRLVALESVEALQRQLKAHSLEEVYLRCVNENAVAVPPAGSGGLPDQTATAG